MLLGRGLRVWHDCVGVRVNEGMRGAPRENVGPRDIEGSLAQGILKVGFSERFREVGCVMCEGRLKVRHWHVSVMSVWRSRVVEFSDLQDQQ